MPAGATDGVVRVKNLGGMSNGKPFTVTNPAVVNYIVPTSAKAGQAVSVYGKYFGTKGTGSYVHFSNGSGAYVAANVIGWADNRIDITVPAQAATGKMKVLTAYGDSNLTDFTMLTGNPPNRPVPSSPSNGALQQPLSPTLTTQDFIDPDGDAHQASWWEVREASQTYSNPIYTSGIDTVNKVQIMLPPNGMKYGTTYYWRVKFQDARGDWSDWSDQFQFKTTDGGGTANNVPPVKPTNESPAADAQNVDSSGAIGLSASAYVDGETAAGQTGATVHESSSWQIRSFDGTYGNSVFEKLTTSVPLTSVNVPAGTLIGNRTYCWHVSYRDVGGSSSAYSTETCFKTKNANGTPSGGSSSGGSSGGSSPLPVYDAPSVPASFDLTNDSGAYVVRLVSAAYVDSDTDDRTGSSDKLSAVEWQVSANSGSFNSAKKFRSLRENCPSGESDAGGDCLLKMDVDYGSLGAVGTYYVRVRHMDEYGIWSEASQIRSFSVDKLPISGYSTNFRTIANLTANVVSGDTSGFSYDWNVTNPGMSVVPVASCGSVQEKYAVYSHCVTNGSTVYGYVIGKNSENMKFEPVKIGNYLFQVTVTKNGISKTADNVAVNVSR